MGMPKYQWKEVDDNVHYYFETSSGLVIGMVHKINYSVIYLVKIIDKNEEIVLGRYISCEHAKVALENYYFLQSQTLLA